MALVELIMPKMGESIMEATILTWLKKPGDKIEQDESVLEVATDKSRYRSTFYSWWYFKRNTGAERGYCKDWKTDCNHYYGSRGCKCECTR